jgi:hypothetical protein
MLILPQGAPLRKHIDVILCIEIGFELFDLHISACREGVKKCTLAEAEQPPLGPRASRAHRWETAHPKNLRTGRPRSQGSMPVRIPRPFDPCLHTC